MPNKPFHNWLPEWACTSLDNRICSQCKSKYSKENIIAVGVRKIEDPNYVMYIEHQCSKCGFRALTILGKHKEDSLEKLCYTILESIKKRKLSEKSKLVNKHKTNEPISDGEVTKFLNFINSKKNSHDDFLREIGVVFPKNNDNDQS